MRLNSRVPVTRRPIAQVFEAHTFPSPTMGLDVTQQLAGGNPLTATVLRNLIPRVYGIELREGYTRWQFGMPAEGRTIMGYIPPVGVAEKIFSCCSNGDIFDVTLPEPAVLGSPVLNVPNQTDPGNFSFINFRNEANSFLLAVSEGGGYFSWDGAAWTEHTAGDGTAGTIGGIDPVEFCYIWEWASRLWFAQRNSLSVWYLPVGAISGVAIELNIGALCAHGGSIYAGVNWTLDGGGSDAGNTSSMSNKIVFITDQGDIIIYGGSDPEDATKFELQGRWYIGRVPFGRRAISRYGSDVAILSERGLCFLSELLRGQGFFKNAIIAQRINAELALQVSTSLTARYWEVRTLPHEQGIMINVAGGVYVEEVQWFYEVNTQGFCHIVGMPMLSLQTVSGRTMFSDIFGNIWLGFSGDSDGSTSAARGLDIEGIVITAFQPLGDGIHQKIAEMLKIGIVSVEQPSVSMQINFNFDASIPPESPAISLESVSRWNRALWGKGKFVGGERPFTIWRGAQGEGVYGALSLRMKGTPHTKFINWTGVFVTGDITGN